MAKWRDGKNGKDVEDGKMARTENWQNGKE